MSSRRSGGLRRFFGGLWAAIDITRRVVVNALFLLLVAVVLFIWLVDLRPSVQDNTALVLELRGRIVEQYTGTAAEAAITRLLGETERETQLRDVLDALDAAAADPRITRAVLLLDDMGEAGLATLREVAAAIGRFRAAGKEVIAWSTTYDQRQYYLAAHADEVFMHPYGFVLVRGFGGYRNYYREALDRLGISINVFRAGQFKSFAEPFTQTGPSKEAAEDEAAWLNDAWRIYTADVEKARGLEAGQLSRLIEDLPGRFKQAGGDAAQLAVAEKLVTRLMTRDEVRAMLMERGAKDREGKSFRGIRYTDYLDRLPTKDEGDAVGVIVAAGEIIDGDAPQGLVGARTTAELIRRARESKEIKAVVLRVDSPGGVLIASELIRRELELTRQAGKPVVVSMGDVAASGGYWISMAADEVLADPGTITGSIGVFALLPTADKAWEKLGVHTGGVTTTWLAGAGDPRRPLDKRVAEILQAAIANSYKQFIGQVAKARDMSPEQIEPLAQGRVWTGRQAKEQGLVDTLGGFADALGAAASRAKIGGEYRVVFVEPEVRGLAQLLSVLFAHTAAALPAELRAWATPPLMQRAAHDILQDLRWLRLDRLDPRETHAHCLCALR
ncbi:MAG TPA: signal peptide peptidase SppA [Burkholderiaceae bacterium]|nr:signal peptide peptidase SppA [Burkholderiaceae bacterium]